MSDTPESNLLALLQASLQDSSFAKLILAKPRVADADLVRVSARLLTLKERVVVSVVETRRTRDLTTNLAFDAAILRVQAWLEAHFHQAHLFTATEEIELRVSKKGRRTLLRRLHGQAPAEVAPADASAAAKAAVGKTPAGKTSAEKAPAEPHDRAKQRVVDLGRPYLCSLGVTDAQHRLVPAMARKWKQINKFVEVLDHALMATSLGRGGSPVEVLDFGSGKGYLTFATHDHLRHTLGMTARVTGVDLKADMIALCNAAAQEVAAEGLHFEFGDVRSHAPQHADIMIALHACDTATDHAIHAGLRAGAQVIMCSPCCHKELRPQLLSPHPLRPLLKHGVHLGQQAEMLTDGLRALLLEACGYDAQVFEFVALEHTSKNKMILAVKRPGRGPSAKVWQQIQDLKGFYGIRQQCLEGLLLADRGLPFGRGTSAVDLPTTQTT